MKCSIPPRRSHVGASMSPRPTPRPRRYVPKFEGAIEGYVANFLRANYWRVAASMEFEDCLQEARWLFLKLDKRYGVMDSPKHFMALYKQSWHRYFIDLSKRDTKQRNEVSDINRQEEGIDTYNGFVEAIVGDTDCSGSLLILIQQAPEDVRTVLSFLLGLSDISTESEIIFGKGGNRKAAGSNKILCQLLGFPNGTDILGRIYSYFGVQ